ncbi:hypothetical protein [Luteolibacter marinus]|uniref:hypothetical protein n=1 Tax=Luteolibacter marinus TaxID=2776705 RepID=UPI0018664608|nr:hypothetical protein [Luteolibacter marinus]
MNRRLVIALLLIAGPLPGAGESVPTQRVGRPLEIRDVYIPGGEVKPKPRRDREPPLVVRILAIKPAKDGSRYDFEVQGLEPGRHDLADFLEGDGIPGIPLEITTSLPPGLAHPHPNEPAVLPDLGGYRTKMIVLGSIWAAGLVAILLWRKKKPARANDDTIATASLADRLRPLVSQAATGQLSTDDRAKLERLIIGHWREKRPEIAALAPAEAMIQLRHDTEAAPLLRALEQWLHSRTSNSSAPALEDLLAPYSN